MCEVENETHDEGILHPAMARDWVANVLNTVMGLLAIPVGFASMFRWMGKGTLWSIFGVTIGVSTLLLGGYLLVYAWKGRDSGRRKAPDW